MKSLIALQQCHKPCQQGIRHHMIWLIWNFLLPLYITTVFNIFFSMDAEGEHRYFMLGDNSFFQAQNPLLWTTIYRHSKEPHIQQEKNIQANFFPLSFCNFFSKHCNYYISRQIVWSIWETGVSSLFHFVHSYSTIMIATGALISLATQQPFYS